VNVALCETAWLDAGAAVSSPDSDEASPELMLLPELPDAESVPPPPALPPAEPVSFAVAFFVLVSPT
jgi:hypothetical protein